MRAVRTYFWPKAIPGDWDAQGGKPSRRVQNLSLSEDEARQERASRERARIAKGIRTRQAQTTRAKATEILEKADRMVVSDREVYRSEWVDNGKGRMEWKLSRIA
jgi:hypothetical protein